MSGGHFDYRQYYIEDIADSIEKKIEEVVAPKPPKVWKDSVMACEKLGNTFCRGVNTDSDSYDEAIKKLKRNDNYKLIREYEKDGKRISEFMHSDKLIEVRELRYQEYEDGEYYPEYTDETIQIFKDAVKILRKAAIYAQRIDWLLSGDDGEESMKERLKEELKELEDGNEDDDNLF